MPSLVHDHHLHGTGGPCEAWHEGDVATGDADAVTCPECLRRLADADACPSRSTANGRRCVGRRGHGGLHHCEADGHVHAWTDETSPPLSWELHHPK